MDLARPVRSVIPSAHGAVLTVLARTTEPLSGRRIAALSGAVSQRRANDVLRELVDVGIVHAQRRPPAIVYTLNRQHVAADGIISLVQQWETLLERIRAELSSWQVPATAAALFGSAARGEATASSGIDILLVVPEDGTRAGASQAWEEQVAALTEHVTAWSGNACDVLELTRSELKAAAQRQDCLVTDLRSGSIALAGQDVRALVRRLAAAS